MRNKCCSNVVENKHNERLHLVCVLPTVLFFDFVSLFSLCHVLLPLVHSFVRLFWRSLPMLSTSNSEWLMFYWHLFRYFFDSLLSLLSFRTILSPFSSFASTEKRSMDSVFDWLFGLFELSCLLRFSLSLSPLGLAHSTPFCHFNFEWHCNSILDVNRFGMWLTFYW